MEDLTSVACPGAGVVGGPRTVADRVALVCVRDSRRYGLQVLLREDNAAGDAETGRMSLPTGNVDCDDHHVSVLERCYGLGDVKSRRLTGHGTNRACALGSAGLRLLLATTGILHAVVGPEGIPFRKRIPTRQRRILSGGATDLADYLVRRDMYIDLGRLHFFSRWADPHIGDRTECFLVEIPEYVRVRGFHWHAPEEMLLCWRDQSLSLNFETFTCLRMLTDFSSCNSLLSEYAC